MTLFNCGCRCNCSTASAAAGAVIGVLTAFLQITGVIAIAPVFLWVAFAAAAVYLGVLVLAAAAAGRLDRESCVCTSLNTLLAGILGTILLAVVLLVVDIAAASVLGAVLAGLLVFFAVLTFAGTACFVRYLLNCRS